MQLALGHRCCALRAPPVAGGPGSSPRCRALRAPPVAAQLRAQLVDEERPPLLEQREDEARPLAQRLRRAARRLQQPLEVVPAAQGQRRRPPRRSAPRRLHALGGEAILPRQPPPGDLPRQAELIEQRAVVARDPRGQQVALPGTGGALEALQLQEDFREPLRPVQLRPGLHVLPAEKEAEEVLRRGGLDLPPQPPQRQPVDAREQRPLAPLGPGGALAVAAPQDQALALELQKLRLHRRDTQLAGHLFRGDGPGDADPAAHGVDELALRALRRPPDAALAGRAAGRLQLREPRRPRRRRLGQHGQRQEQVVQLVRRAQVGKGLRDHLRDGLRIERAQRSRVPRIQRPAQLHRPRPALLQRRVVEVGVGRGVEDLVRERRRLRRVPRQHAHLAVAHPLEQPAQPLDVHRLGEAVAQRLPHQRMVGRVDGAGPVLLALRLRRKHLRQQILRAHAQDVEGDFFPAPRAEQRQRAGGVPAPAHAPHRRPQRRLRQHLVDASG